MSNLHPRTQPEKYAPLAVRAGKKLTAIYQQRGLSIEDLEGLSGISHTTIKEVRSGKSSPGIITYLRLCDVLGVSLNDLFDCETPIHEQLEKI